MVQDQLFGGEAFHGGVIRIRPIGGLRDVKRSRAQGEAAQDRGTVRPGNGCRREASRWRCGRTHPSATQRGSSAGAANRGAVQPVGSMVTSFVRGTVPAVWAAGVSVSADEAANADTQSA